ncbi:hypothetical protein F7725_024389, partial [Dissostichus mawsoni]
MTVLSITTQTRVGRDLMAWAGVAGRAAAELKMDKRKKRPGGAEKLRLKKLKSLEVEAAKYSKLTDLFGAGVTTPAGAAAPGDERVEAYMPRQVQGKSSWSVQGESQTNSDSPKTAPPEREKAVESEEYVSPKTGSPEREKAVESEECVSPKTGSLERETAVESEECFSPKTGSPERETAVESCECASQITDFFSQPDQKNLQSFLNYHPQLKNLSKCLQGFDSRATKENMQAELKSFALQWNRLKASPLAEYKARTVEDGSGGEEDNTEEVEITPISCCSCKECP